MARYYGSFTSPRYIGYVNRQEFIDTVADKIGSSKNWVAQRMCETGNHIEIDLMKRNPGQVFKSPSQ